MKSRRIQLFDNEWTPIGNKGYHECCECGLTHTVKYKLHDGVMFEMWTKNKTATKESRKAASRNKRK
jgi:hypothetical protein